MTSKDEILKWRIRTDKSNRRVGWILEALNAKNDTLRKTATPVLPLKPIPTK